MWHVRPTWCANQALIAPAAIANQILCLKGHTFPCGIARGQWWLEPPVGAKAGRRCAMIRIDLPRSISPSGLYIQGGNFRFRLSCSPAARFAVEGIAACRTSGARPAARELRQIRPRCSSAPNRMCQIGTVLRYVALGTLFQGLAPPRVGAKYGYRPCNQGDSLFSSG